MNSSAAQAAVPHLIDRIRENGLLAVGRPALVMLSGGGDSVALIAAAARVCGAGFVTALHVNYGLRGEESEADESFCRKLCEELGVAIVVERVTLGEDGNLHDLAREARYRLAHEAAERAGCETIAVAHNADDRAETLLYRLAASPGRRALLGMPPQRGMIVRPLLDFTREELRAWCVAESLTWREDAANFDPRFARTNVREALALLRRVHPAAIDNILRTADELEAEAGALNAVVEDLLVRAVVDADHAGTDADHTGTDADHADTDADHAGTDNEGIHRAGTGDLRMGIHRAGTGDLRMGDSRTGGLRVAALDGVSSPLAGLALRAYVERVVGAPVPAARTALDRVRAAAAAGGSREIDVAGARLIVEYGVLRVIDAGGNDPAIGDLAREPISLPVPGSVSFGDWRITTSIGPAPDIDKSASAPPASPHPAHLDIPVTAAEELTIRTRRPGDRMRPLGLNGGKSLQDIFVDAKLPRAERDGFPVVCAGEPAGEQFGDGSAERTAEPTGERIGEMTGELTGERIVWIPGIAIGEGCARRPDAAEPFVRITAERRPTPGGHAPKLPRS